MKFFQKNIFCGVIFVMLSAPLGAMQEALPHGDDAALAVALARLDVHGEGYVAPNVLTTPVEIEAAGLFEAVPLGGPKLNVAELKPAPGGLNDQAHAAAAETKCHACCFGCFLPTCRVVLPVLITIGGAVLSAFVAPAAPFVAALTPPALVAVNTMMNNLLGAPVTRGGDALFDLFVDVASGEKLMQDLSWHQRMSMVTAWDAAPWGNGDQHHVPLTDPEDNTITLDAFALLNAVLVQHDQLPEKRSGVQRKIQYSRERYVCIMRHQELLKLKQDYTALSGHPISIRQMTKAEWKALQGK